MDLGIDKSLFPILRTCKNNKIKVDKHTVCKDVT